MSSFALRKNGLSRSERRHSTVARPGRARQVTLHAQQHGIGIYAKSASRGTEDCKEADLACRLFFEKSFFLDVCQNGVFSACWVSREWKVRGESVANPLSCAGNALGMRYFRAPMCERT